MNMNKINKLAQVTVVVFAMNGAGSEELLANDSSSPLYIGTENCKIAPEQNACHIFLLNPGTRFPVNTAPSIYKQISGNLTAPNTPDRFTFTLTAHHGASSYTERLPLDRQGLMSARFGLSKAEHNESLKAVDGDTSNEHAQVSLTIQVDSIPTIENYVQFFTRSGYFTVAK